MFYRRTIGGKADRIVNGIHQTQFICVALSGVAKACSVIHRGTDDRKAQCDVHTGHRIPFTSLPVIHKAFYLQWDVALIMVHADNDIVPPTDRLTEHRVCWRGFSVWNADALGQRRIDRRLDLIYFLPAEQAILTTMGIQTRNSDLIPKDLHPSLAMRMQSSTRSFFTLSQASRNETCVETCTTRRFSWASIMVYFSVPVKWA